MRRSKNSRRKVSKIFQRGDRAQDFNGTQYMWFVHNRKPARQPTKTMYTHSACSMFDGQRWIKKQQKRSVNRLYMYVDAPEKFQRVTIFSRVQRIIL